MRPAFLAGVVFSDERDLLVARVIVARVFTAGGACLWDLFGLVFQGWRGAMVGVMPGVAARARRTVGG